MKNKPVILASASPRRLELLKQAGIVPAQIIPTDIDETPLARELPAQLAVRLAIGKANATPISDSFVIAADTVVACGRRILPKAETVEEAKNCLTLMSGRQHTVFGGLAIRAPDGRIVSRIVTTKVKFKRLSAHEIETYLKSGEWQGKAGGYAIQGLAAAFIPAINGSYSNVVGLSLYDTLQILNGLGYHLGHTH